VERGMTLRRLVGLVFAAAGLAVVVSASATPPTSGCPAAVADPAAITLTPMLTVDYCAGETPVSDAFTWFLLLNGVGAVAFVGGLGLVSFERLGWLQRQLVD
jgi:opacity protein-like surface antigen